MVVDLLETDSARCANKPTGGISLDVSGGVPGYTFNWETEAMIIPDPSLEDLENIFSGFYKVTVLDSNSCELVDTITVYEADYFDVMLEIASNYHGVPISCYGYSDGAINLTPQGGTGPYTYLWNTDDTTRNLVGLKAGEYRVNIVDDWGCADSASVVLEEPTAMEYSLKQEDPLCFNDANGSIELLITGGTVDGLDDYQVWLNEVLAGPLMADLTRGDYHIRIQDLNQCFVETDVELVHPDTLIMDFQTVAAYCPDTPDGSMDLYVSGGNGAYYISWNQGLADNEVHFTGLYSGQYVATVTDYKNCVAVDSAEVAYEHEWCLRIPTAFSPNGDGFNDTWIIENLELYPQVDLKIFDRWGSLIFVTGNAADEAWDGTLDGRKLPIDSYHWVIDLNYQDYKPITGNVTIVR